MDRLKKPKDFLEKLRLTDSDYQDSGMINHIADLLERYNTEQLTLTDVSFSLFDKVYMDSPFGRYTGVVKGVEKNKVIIESYSPMGKGMMLADYDLNNNDWKKY